MDAIHALPHRPKLAALTAIVATVLAGASGAQQQDSPRENANRPPAAASQSERSTQIARSDAGMQTLEQHLQSTPIRMSKLVGMEIQNREGDNLGEVRNVIGSSAPGQDMQLVMATGGIGADEKLVAIPFDQIQVSADGDELYTARTADQLATAPAVSRDTSSRQPHIGDLVGAEVVGSSGDRVGEVEDLVISTAGADTIRAVLQVGGLAGIGEKRISLPLSQLDVERAPNDNEPTVRVAMEGEALQRMPEFEYEEDTTAL